MGKLSQISKQPISDRIGGRLYIFEQGLYTGFYSLQSTPATSEQIEPVKLDIRAIGNPTGTKPAISYRLNHDLVGFLG